MSEIIKEYGLVIISMISVAAILIVGIAATKGTKGSMADTFNAMMGEIGTVEHPSDDTTEPST